MQFKRGRLSHSAYTDTTRAIRRLLGLLCLNKKSQKTVEPSSYRLGVRRSLHFPDFCRFSNVQADVEYSGDTLTYCIEVPH